MWTDSARRSRRATCAPAWILAGLLAACGEEYGVIDQERTGLEGVGDFVVGESTRSRFQSRDANGSLPTAAPSTASSPFTWTLPEGWREVAPRSSQRLADFELDGEPHAECYITTLSGTGGGVVANIDRWRRQMGQGPMDPAEVASLPTLPVLGRAATFVTIDGSFAGMQGETVEDARLMGLLCELPAATVFVKCIGPRDVVAASEERFVRFVASLGLKGGPAPAAPRTAEAPVAEPSAGPPQSGEVSIDGPLPAGWTLGGDRPMRLMTLVTPAGELSVSRAGGGLVPNLGRWYGQMGQSGPSEAELAALTRVPMLGTEAVLVDLVGPFSGMGADDYDEARLLGLVCPVGPDHLFLKLVGLPQPVAAERLRLVQFAQSLVVE